MSSKYNFEVKVFKKTDIYFSIQGEIFLLDDSGKRIDKKMFNGWEELGYWMPELLKKHKYSVEIIGKNKRVLAKKYTRCGKLKGV